MRSLYVIGAPGVGKTSLMAEVTRPWGDPEVRHTPVPHLRWGGRAEVGRRRGEFSGTDALGYAVVPSAVAWVASPQRPELLLGEGDRLACRAFLDALRAAGASTVVCLTGPAAWTRARSVDRSARLGREPQNEAWWQGRLTKTAHLALDYDAVMLDARRPTVELAAEVRALLA